MKAWKDLTNIEQVKYALKERLPRHLAMVKYKISNQEEKPKRISNGESIR